MKEAPAYPDKIVSKIDMAKAIIPQVELSDHKVFVIETPQQKQENGSIRRPNTGDTILEWLKNKELKPGKVLAISTQPFTIYQDAVVKTFLPKDKGWHVTTAGFTSR